jgi:hypothetical protein
MGKLAVNDDLFAQLSPSAQALYLHLIMSADSDGYSSKLSMGMRKAKASVNDLEALLKDRFILADEDGVIVVKSARMVNMLRMNEYTEKMLDNDIEGFHLDESLKIISDDKAVKKKAKQKQTQEVFFPESGELEQRYLDYLEVRRKAKIPNTERSKELGANNVRKYCTASDGNLDIELAMYTIEQSINYGWRGIFAPKDEHKQLITPKVRANKPDSEGIDLWSED